MSNVWSHGAIRGTSLLSKVDVPRFSVAADKWSDVVL